MTTQSQVTCPSCGLPWVLIAGRFPLHTSKGETCRMSYHQPAEWPLPPALHFEPIEISPSPAPKAIKEPGRKVRSDKGTKRGQRTRGGEHSVRGGLQDSPGIPAAPGGPPSQEPERVAARPPTKVEDWLKTSLPATTIHGLGEADSTAALTGDPDMILPAESGIGIGSMKNEKAQRKPRSDRAQYMVVAEPELFATEAAAFEAAESHLADPEDNSRYQVFQVRWRGNLEKGIKVTRLGRVRRGTP